MTTLTPGDPHRLAAAARDGLARALGARAQAVGRAPGRVNLIGEHTDYNGGLVLPVALPHATYAAAAPRRDDAVRIASAQQDGVFTATLDELGPGRVEGWAAYAAGVVWALREEGIAVPGIDLYVDSTVPLGAGLSSSAALECSVGVATLALAGVAWDASSRRLLVAAGIRAETEVAGAPTGGMDQTIAVHAVAGGALLIDFAAEGVDRVGPVPLPLAEHTLLVTDTRVSHRLVDGGYGDRRAECEKAAVALGVDSLREVSVSDLARIEDPTLRRRARHVVTEIRRVRTVVDALGAGDWSTVGAAFGASHASMRDDLEISTPELDLAVDSAVAAGAVAARMTGGGFGGSTVALVPTTRLDAATAAIEVAFAGAGYAPPAQLVVEPAAGARLVG